MKKILFISEALSRPFDEGIKNVAFSLHTQLQTKTGSVSVTKEDNNTDGLEIKRVSLNKLFLNIGLRRILQDYSPDIILYLPEASITFNSYIRSRVLKLLSKASRVVVLGVKHIEYSAVQKKIIAKLFKPDLLLLLGRFEMEFFQDAGFRVKVLPPAVDNTRFRVAANGEKEIIRAEFEVEKDKTLVLHVGHIRTTRNVECLLEVQKINGVQVVIVGSTSTAVENDLKERLERGGIHVINRAIPDISKIYRMSDIYVFPVMNKIACIDMPLSVLEAMACNLPIITTRFGGLTGYFQDDTGFKYFETVDELIALVKVFRDKNGTAINNKKMDPFTWSRFTDEAVAACNGLA